ncbi:formylmethanofuran dehydrogenase subunit B [Candidatus Bathyarchaeota archaeon]|nr:MAG: formylmethanofuran dehydrogenase subunit B [Candidatus Bathyarchaeota archaeon]
MTVIRDVVCPFCGCLCDDLEVTVEGNKIVKTRNTCAISSAKYMHHEENRITAPSVDGREVPLDEAVEAAAEILASARRPLVYGLSSTECGAIAKAVELAELVGGVVDNTASVCHGPTILALQAVGESKCTLGEVKNRADLVIFWGCNPTEAHLRHLIRYSGMPKGLYTPEGRKGRYIVAVDVRETRMKRLADQFLKIEPNGDFELLSALRAAVREVKVQAETVAGVPREQIEALAERMKRVKMGVIFFGLGLTQSDGRHMNIDAAVGLVADLNHHTKFVLTPMRGHYNVAGANTVTAWQTGYPYAVDFSRGYPRYNPGEYTAVDLLARGEADAALIVASDPAAHFPADAARHLARIPVVTLDQKVNMTTMLSKVVIPVATAGVEAEGTAYRMDGVPIRLRKVVEPSDGVLPDAEVLQMIIDRVRALKEGA